MFHGVSALVRTRMLAEIDLADIEDLDDDEQLIPELEAGERLLIRVRTGRYLCLIIKTLLKSRFVGLSSNEDISPTTRSFQGALLQCAITMTHSHFHNNDLEANNISKITSSDDSLRSEYYQHLAVYREMLIKSRKTSEVRQY